MRDMVCLQIFHEYDLPFSPIYIINDTVEGYFMTYPKV